MSCAWGSAGWWEPPAAVTGPTAAWGSQDRVTQCSHLCGAPEATEALCSVHCARVLGLHLCMVSTLEPSVRLRKAAGETCMKVQKRFSEWLRWMVVTWDLL